MQIASQPEAAIYRKPMVYVNFVRMPLGNLDDAGASGSGQPQAELEDDSTEYAVLKEVHERRVTHNFVQNKRAILWWSARIDYQEYLPDQSLKLESDEDVDLGSHGSEENASHDAHNVCANIQRRSFNRHTRPPSPGCTTRAGISS